METPETAHCPICDNDLPISGFGICRARKTGRNLYCKGCIRVKVANSRQILREYKASRKKYAEQQKQIVELELLKDEPMSIYKLAPVERVREAIRNNYRTQKEIEKFTKLGKDEIGDAIASLLLWTKEIRTVMKGETRLYFINEPVEFVSYPQRDSLVEIARKGLGPVTKGERKVRTVA